MEQARDPTRSLGLVRSILAQPGQDSAPYLLVLCTLLGTVLLRHAPFLFGATPQVPLAILRELMGGADELLEVAPRPEGARSRSTNTHHQAVSHSHARDWSLSPATGAVKANNGNRAAVLVSVGSPDRKLVRGTAQGLFDDTLTDKVGDSGSRAASLFDNHIEYISDLPLYRRRESPMRREIKYTHSYSNRAGPDLDHSALRLGLSYQRTALSGEPDASPIVRRVSSRRHPIARVPTSHRTVRTGPYTALHET